MDNLTIFNTDGKNVGTRDVPEVWKQGPVNAQVLKETLLMYQGRHRRGTASTLNRSRVKASGAKPWRQKGTGRARAGTVASPIWRGGGVIFGPRPRDFGFSVPKKVRKAARVQAMRLQVREGNVSLLKGLRLEEPKTKKLAEILNKLEAGTGSLIVVRDQETNLKLSARNIPSVTICRACDLNAEIILRYERILILEEAMELLLEDRSAKKKES